MDTFTAIVHDPRGEHGIMNGQPTRYIAGGVKGS